MSYLGEYGLVEVLEIILEQVLKVGIHFAVDLVFVRFRLCVHIQILLRSLYYIDTMLPFVYLLILVCILCTQGF
jgi:hypothetical protein